MYKKILLIEDDEDEQFFFSEALKELNIPAKFCAASSPEEGIELMKFLLPDMVFIDINMPLLNGFECVKLIKHDETINKIPIVLYSTMADSSMLQQAIEKGAATCIKKQDSIHMLAGILKQMIIEPGSIYKE